MRCPVKTNYLANALFGIVCVWEDCQFYVGRRGAWHVACVKVHLKSIKRQVVKTFGLGDNFFFFFLHSCIREENKVNVQIMNAGVRQQEVEGKSERA